MLRVQKHATQPLMSRRTFFTIGLNDWSTGVYFQSRNVCPNARTRTRASLAQRCKPRTHCRRLSRLLRCRQPTTSRSHILSAASALQLVRTRTCSACMLMRLTFRRSANPSLMSLSTGPTGTVQFDHASFSRRVPQHAAPCGQHISPIPGFQFLTTQAHSSWPCRTRFPVNTGSRSAR